MFLHFCEMLFLELYNAMPASRVGPRCSNISNSPLMVRGCEDAVPIALLTLQVNVLPPMSAGGWLMVSTF